jgi:hypothetical protein
VHVVEHSSDSSDDESSEVLTAEFVWPSRAKSLTYNALKSTHKNGKMILNICLMWLVVIRFSMNCIRVATSRFLILYRRLRS